MIYDFLCKPMLSLLQGLSWWAVLAEELFVCLFLFSCLLGCLFVGWFVLFPCCVVCLYVSGCNCVCALLFVTIVFIHANVVLTPRCKVAGWYSRRHTKNAI